MLLQSFRKHQKSFAIFTLLVFGFTFIPTTSSYALSSGPSQPETQQFAPAGMDNMVDPFTGDFSYNIPLMDIGGYPININYAAGITPDAEASWVGLGWNLNVGAINRNMRGLPDDFKGDEVEKTFSTKPNQTFSLNLALKDEIYGANLSTKTLNSKNITLSYNTYNGFSASFGISPRKTLDIFKKGKFTSALNFNFSLGSEEGLGFTPQLSMGFKKDKADKDATYNTTTSFPYNTREGLKGMSFGASRPNVGLNYFAGFAAQSYTPTIPHNTYSVNLDLGLSLSFIADAAKEFKSYDIKGFYAGQFLENKVVSKSSYGYLYSGIDNSANSLLDFNREKDGMYDKNTKNLALTSLTHDIFAASGQGVGGSFRLYRSDIGTVNDPETKEKSFSPSLGVDLDIGSAGVIVAKMGIDLKYDQSSSTSGKWDDDAIPEFKSPDNVINKNQELVYFKKIGENNIETDANQPFYSNQQYNTDLVKPSVANIVSLKPEVFSPSGKTYALKNDNIRPERINKNESFTYLTAEEAMKNSFRPSLKSFSQTDFKWSTNIQAAPAYNDKTIAERLNKTYVPTESFDRTDKYKKAHHISEIRLTQGGGTRYIYGIPVYNTEHYESSFSVSSTGDNSTGLVTYTSDENSDNNSSGLDHMYSKTKTPPYAISYLLTDVLSPDYVDSDGIKGPTDGDLGNYTKFNYTKLTSDYHWRTPIANQSNKASYNEGLKSDDTDNKGSIVYGSKEIWYMHSVETRTHVAEFYTEDRLDGLGVIDENGVVGGVKQKLLRKIVLYSKADKRNGNPVPIKTVHFDYTYELCPGTPNSQALAVSGKYAAQGKLTLKKIWFTYGNSKKGTLNPYIFEYPTTTNLNPAYSIKNYDRWGNYKQDLVNGVSNAEFPYTPQNKALADEYASVYNLKTITTPTGGKINIFYESDDYAYVQNKQAMRMFKIHSSSSEILYSDKDDNVGKSINVDLGDGFTTTDMTNAGYTDPSAYFRDKYLSGIDKMYFNFKIELINFNDRKEFVSAYADIDVNASEVISSGDTYTVGKIALKKKNFGNFVSGREVNDIVKNAWMFTKMNMGRTLMGSADAENNGFEQVAGVILSALTNVISMVSGFPNYMMGQGNAKFYDRDQSYVRLKEPDFIKLGGGHRVKAVVMQDQWKAMTSTTNDVDAFYGQYYSYTTKDNGQVISAGVAVYEPILGGEENPFRTPLYKEDDSNWFSPPKESFIDGPYGESFFPGAGVGYSKVTVTPIKLKSLSETDIDNSVSNGTGAVVHEFYTAKDFPTRVSQTDLESQRLPLPGVDVFMFYFKVDLASCTQGYMVELNDMHGKQKAQSVIPANSSLTYPKDYASSEGKDAISKVIYTYKKSATDNTKLSNLVTVINPSMKVEKDKEMGVEVDVVHDQRFHDYTSAGGGVELNFKMMVFGIFPVLVPTAWPDVKFEYSRFKSLVTTKVVNRFAILDSTIATENGSTISTRNVAYDKVTGEPILSTTVNEFHDNVYNFTYPAHWAYNRMKMASINEGMVFTNPALVIDKIIDGDEVAVVTSQMQGDINLSGNYTLRKDATTSAVKFFDNSGLEVAIAAPYTAKIIRSGYRNMQSTPIGSLSMLSNPIQADNTLKFENILSAGATEFKDTWKQFCNCPGDNDASVDAYSKGLIGLIRPWRSHTYLTGKTQNRNNNQLDIRKDGVFAGTFVPFWQTASQINALNAACNSTKTFTTATASGGLSPISSGKAYLCSPWQYVTEITNYNAIGMEIENRDALGRYSMAQFGYGRLLPVATSNNSKYQESGFDGFEDYSYQDCKDDHFSWRYLNNFVPPTTNGTAHTGSKSIKVEKKTRLKLTKQVGACQE